MTCAEACDRLMEADPAELEAGGKSELSQHLDACERCRALAIHILNAQWALGAALAEKRPRAQVGVAIRAAEVTAAARRRGHRWWAAAPLAAAAGLTGLLLFEIGGSELPGEMWQPRPVEAASGVDVEAPPGQDVVVFDIKDRPDVVVVWFFEKGDE